MTQNTSRPLLHFTFCTHRLCRIPNTANSKLGQRLAQTKPFKDDVHSVLRISSAHNKGGPPDINIAQILQLSNFFELKRTVYIHLQV